MVVLFLTDPERKRETPRRFGMLRDDRTRVESWVTAWNKEISWFFFWCYSECLHTRQQRCLTAVGIWTDKPKLARSTPIAAKQWESACLHAGVKTLRVTSTKKNKHLKNTTTTRRSKQLQTQIVWDIYFWKKVTRNFKPISGNTFWTWRGQ